MKCPFCAEEINDDAIKCKRCGEFLNEGNPHTRKAKELPLGWFKFYTYFRIPVGILISIPQILTIPPGTSPILVLINIMDLFLTVALFIGLHRRTKWGWKLNFICLGIETLFAPFRFDTGLNLYFPTLLVMSLIWLLPNIVYFKKRKYVFYGSTPNITPILRKQIDESYAEHDLCDLVLTECNSFKFEGAKLLQQEFEFSIEEAKALVSSMPSTLLEHATKQEAESALETLKGYFDVKIINTKPITSD